MLASVTACVLAGGQGQRMGGQDKGLVSLNGRPLVEHVLSRIQPQVQQMIINANRSFEAYAQYGFPVFQDTRPDFAGPLAGVEVALMQSHSDFVLTVPCDVPFLPEDLLDRMLTTLNEQDLEVVVAATPSEHGRDLHPVIALYQRQVLPSLQAFLDSGKRKVRDWQCQLAYGECVFDNAKAFQNINDRNSLESPWF